MTRTSSHPAIFAGLLGAASWSVPTLALATPAEGVIEIFRSSLLLQFVAGCALGAGLAGAVVFVMDRIDERREVEVEDEVPEDDRWSESSLNLVRVQTEQVDDDPTGDLGRYRTGQITIDFPVLNEEPAASESRRPRHSKHMAAAKKTTKAAAPRRAGRHFATSEHQEVLVASIVSSISADEPLLGKHFAENVVVTRVAKEELPEIKEELPEIRVELPEIKQDEPVAAAVEAPKPATISRRERLANLPTIDAKYTAPVAEKAKPASEPMPVQTFEAESASVEVKQKSEKNERSSAGITGRIMMRMAERTRGVREVLADRLGSDAMDGVPIIRRADGSVGDVSPRWFDQSFVPALANITGVTGKLDDTAERLVTEEKNPEIKQEKVATESSRASYISRHVAEVNVGMFPERRSADELEHEDVWEEALHAMGETIAQETPVFNDVVGGPATIDDPDDLEGPTGFIPFRVPAAHPEVVDTDTYVDYLLRDELSHNGSQVLRNSKYANLRVIEGGTSPRLMRRRVSDTGTITTGRHFAQPELRAQA